ncbi:DUF4145 domain-containing protein [Alteromonas sp. D210916BOD_24]|uniref:DUF4145 domain-containing protein n=1 Tax=Alteromonas sp. D210916BOD_24 TaxID=3157618 RepID=UPI00399C648C
MTESIWNNCSSCGRSTKHQVITRKSVISPPNEYHSEAIYFMLECNGCESICFRREYHDYEDYFQVGEDEFEHSTEVAIFPNFIDGHVPIHSLWRVPTIVKDIYEESLKAIRESAYTLAGLGLRATIEAICNDKKIKGKNLQTRINAMQRSGMISKSDANRLHAIRFMGNDAAHEIKKSSHQSVLIALKIIEHMLLSVYLLEAEVNKHLEPPLANLSEAKTLLKEKLIFLEPNSVFTFSKWVGTSKRRFEESFSQIEAEVIDLIKNGDFTWVELVDPPEVSSDKEPQWFRRTDKKISQIDIDLGIELDFNL